MSHLATAEAQAGFTLSHRRGSAPPCSSGLVVVLIHGHGELDLLDRNHLLLFLGGALALFFFVEEAAVILDAADRGTALAETSTRSRPRSLASLSASKEPGFQLLAVFVDYADSRARIFSLMRIKDFAERLSSAMVLLQKSLVPVPEFAGIAAGARRNLSIALARLC